MKYRKLGRTGFDVSVLSYGGSSLGSVFRKINENEGIKTVCNAFDSGINYFDNSPFYGITEGERIMGQALKEIPRDKYYLSTKTGRFGWNEFDFSFDRIIRSAEESMKRLNVDYIDILNLHDIEYSDGFYFEQSMNEGIPALQELKRQGKIRFFGIATYSLPLIRKVIELYDIEVNIKNEITKLRNETKQKIIDAPSNKDKESIFREFRNQTIKIADNKLKYQNIKKKRDNYHNIINKFFILYKPNKQIKTIKPNIDKINSDDIDNNSYHNELDKLTNKYVIDNNTDFKAKK